MSVVVRMERVPRNCDDGCWGSLSGECPWCDSIDGYKMAGNRPPNCPIIAVLPEGHGRLIDSDALIDVLGIMGDKGGNPVVWMQMRYIAEDMHTIVPAERREE